MEPGRQAPSSSGPAMVLRIAAYRSDFSAKVPTGQITAPRGTRLPFHFTSTAFAAPMNGSARP